MPWASSFTHRPSLYSPLVSRTGVTFTVDILPFLSMPSSRLLPSQPAIISENSFWN